MSKAKAPDIGSISAAQLQELKAELKEPLSPPLFQRVEWLLETLEFLLGVIEQKTHSVARLKRMLFGHQTEKASNVLSGARAGAGAAGRTSPKTKAKGHGRKGAKDYPGAKTVSVPHPEYQAGQLCPKCGKGKLYLFKDPARLIRIVAQPICAATGYELQRLRCVLCGALFTAPAPAEAGVNKYHSSVGTMLAIMRYGVGLPMYRMDKWQNYFGIPLPAGTQWQLMNAACEPIEGVHEELIKAAAQGSLVHNDDTTMWVQQLAREIADSGATEEKSKRTGIFTTGIVSLTGDRQIALFFTGQKHAGENLTDLLGRRSPDLGKPLQMCDALSRNESKTVATTLCNCILHGRRNVVDIAENFPQECGKVIDTLAEVYRIDGRARKEKLCNAQRLALHQEHSRPLMDNLHAWMKEQFDRRKVEPNSSLGGAIAYMIKFWIPLTRFLEVPGAPLDNNIVERALKMAILHRKNSLRYKTSRGAKVGDIFMSLIQTCQLNRVNPFEYLMALQENAEVVKKDPTRWLPWNYRQAPVVVTDTS